MTQITHQGRVVAHIDDGHAAAFDVSIAAEVIRKSVPKRADGLCGGVRLRPHSEVYDEALRRNGIPHPHPHGGHA